ncbi:MAG TPA: DUF1707 and FHA domain-containing protein [Streptosporangiaceae bacterium]
MAGSSAEAPTTPESVRASDEERDHAVGELREQFAEGRLSHETFMHRMDAALGARDRRQLDRLLADLPRGRAAGALAGLAAEVRDRTRRALGMLASEKEVLSAAIRDVRPGRPDRADRPDRAAGDGPPGALIFPPGAARWYTIGREPDCDLLIGDLTVSRKHARLERAAEGWLLTDLGSTNGTRLNGWRIREPVRLRAGDRVAFGSAVFVMSGPG